MGVAVIRYSEQPHLWQSTEALTREVRPEYNLHGDVLNCYWDRLFDEFPDFQFVLYDEQVREVLAEGHTLPCCWDGTAEGLGDGIDTMIAAAFDAPKTNRGRSTLCALAAEIRPRFQGRGLAKRILEVIGRLRPRRRSRASDRARPPELETPLPDHPDRSVRDLDTRERRTVRPMDPDPHPSRRRDR